MTILSFDLQVCLLTYGFFFTKNPNLKKEILFWGWGIGAVWVRVGGGVDGWTDEQAQTNLPLQLLRSWGHNNALMYKLCPWQAQFMTILSFDLQVWVWPSTYVNKCLNGTSANRRQQLCKIILKPMHKCTSYGPDKLNLWPFWSLFDPYDLTFNLHEKMFQMALFFLKDNNCAKLFWNPCINVQVMARKSSIYDHFDLYLTPVTLTFNLS